MKKEVTIITEEPTIVLLAEQALNDAGVCEMAEWVRSHRPDCVPEEGGLSDPMDLLPHGRYEDPLPPTRMTRVLSDNELLCEFAGRKCYDSFAEKAGKKTNREYFEHIVSMDPMHASILYHAKMTFFFAGVSRKFSHQFIRNYVGSDREEEGSPSQESTRFTHHYGWYVAPPYVLENPDGPNIGNAQIDSFFRESQHNYDAYCTFIIAAVETYKARHGGQDPKGGDRKDIYEAAAGYLSMSAETSFVWTTNPMAIRKFLKERCHAAADAEIFRFSKVLARLCFVRWPNLFLGKDLDGVRKEIGYL